MVLGAPMEVGSRWQPFRISAVVGGKSGMVMIVLRRLVEDGTGVSSVRAAGYSSYTHTGPSCMSSGVSCGPRVRGNTLRRRASCRQSTSTLHTFTLVRAVVYGWEGPTAGASNRGWRGNCRTMGGGRSWRIAQA